MTIKEKLDVVKARLRSRVTDQVAIKNNDNFTCKCPAHDDNKESLSVGIGDKGIVLNCFAGCDTDDILRELNLSYSVLFADDNNSNNNSGNKKSGESENYIYTDADHNKLYRVVRLPDKRFFQNGWNSDKGKWEMHMQSVKNKVPYKFPRVLNAIKEGKPVFFVEGEKDVHTLEYFGLTATTTPGGANAYSAKKYAEYFEDAILIIITDNDKPGRQYANDVLNSVSDIAKEVRMPNLPLGTFGNGKDVSDWVAQNKKNTGDRLLEIAFETDPVDFDDVNAADPETLEGEVGGHGSESVYEFEEYNNEIYTVKHGRRNSLVADFAIDLVSIVEDDLEKRMFYIRVREHMMGRLKTSDLIEVPPTALDTIRDFKKITRPYSMGEIYSDKKEPIIPLYIFKWLIEKHDKPIVRRPDHVGRIEDTERPYWLFKNCLIAPPHGDKEGQIIEPNKHQEYIVDDNIGFTIPDDDERKSADTLPELNLDHTNIHEFKDKALNYYIELVGGNDDERGKNLAKLELGYCFYHMFADELYHANDINGHTVMMYIHGPKGSGKTTYFGTIAKAFWGMHHIENMSSSVSIPAIENIMGDYCNLIVVTDELDPKTSAIKNSNMNGWYHLSSRTVSDTDRGKRKNKFTPIRSTLTVLSNYMIDESQDQADATISRFVYFKYIKDYRSKESKYFNFFQKNMGELSRITSYMLLNQTEKDRNEIKDKVETLTESMSKQLDATAKDNPIYEVEHRITDNYCRLCIVYEYVIGEKDQEFRNWIKQEMLRRFRLNQSQSRDNKVLSELAHLASEGKIREYQHYVYQTTKEQLYVHLNSLYQVYEDYRQEQAISKQAFKDVLKNEFKRCGGAIKKPVSWYGHYYVYNERRDVNIIKRSYIIDFDKINSEDTRSSLLDIFPPPSEEKDPEIRKLRKSSKDSIYSDDFEVPKDDNEKPKF